MRSDFSLKTKKKCFMFLVTCGQKYVWNNEMLRSQQPPYLRLSRMVPLKLIACFHYPMHFGSDQVYQVSGQKYNTFGAVVADGPC